jgi:pimeloyl-ACP methyl ester carboxylesterase
MLAHSIVTAKSAEPARYMLFLHGILGTRANWRGIARRFVETRPDWGAVLVDLREHGESLGLPAPHSLRAAADDILVLESKLGIPIGGALGHSFGGKVVLEWLESREGTRTEAWIVDSSPSAIPASERNEATAEVLRVLGDLPRRWESRLAFIDAVVRAGQPASIAQWLAMNLRTTEDGQRELGPDLAVVHELLEDYAETDLWGVVESLPGEHTLDIVIGGRSLTFSEADRKRAFQIAGLDPRVAVHVVEDAGHWIHVDAPESLLRLLAARGEEPS